MMIWVEEECPDCGATRERECEQRDVPNGLPVPKGWRLVKRHASWKTIQRRTRFTTLCDCDAA
jgi:hypothetical protein